MPGLVIISGMSKLRYPFQNTTLANLKGERWKDITDLEGHYMLSNMDRIKQLTYERIYKNGAVYIIPERVIKPMICRSRNNLRNDHM